MVNLSYPILSSEAPTVSEICRVECQSYEICCYPRAVEGEQHDLAGSEKRFNETIFAREVKPTVALMPARLLWSVGQVTQYFRRFCTQCNGGKSD